MIRFDVSHKGLLSRINMRIPDESKRQISLYHSGSEWNFAVTCMWKFYLQGQGEMEPGFIVKLIYYIINNV
jgi:hypothetical protein